MEKFSLKKWFTKNDPSYNIRCKNCYHDDCYYPNQRIIANTYRCQYMKQIPVSFKVAEYLKKHHFNEPCKNYYISHDECDASIISLVHSDISLNHEKYYEYAAPDIQTAYDWLNNIFIKNGKEYFNINIKKNLMFMVNNKQFNLLNDAIEYILEEIVNKDLLGNV